MWMQKEMQPLVDQTDSDDRMLIAKKTIQAELQGQGTSLSDCTICHSLNHKGLHGKTNKQKQEGSIVLLFELILLDWIYCT